MNEAFDKLTEATSEFLQSESGRPTAQAILSYHVALGVYPSTHLLSMTSGATLASLYNDGTALIQVWHDTNKENVLLSNVGDEDPPSIRVVRPDILANNGILHVISGIMSLPPAGASTPAPAGGDGLEPTPSTPTQSPQGSGCICVLNRRATAIISGLVTTVTLFIAVW